MFFETSETSFFSRTFWADTLRFSVMHPLLRVPNNLGTPFSPHPISPTINTSTLIFLANDRPSLYHSHHTQHHSIQSSSSISKRVKTPVVNIMRAYFYIFAYQQARAKHWKFGCKRCALIIPFTHNKYHSIQTSSCISKCSSSESILNCTSRASSFGVWLCSQLCSRRAFCYTSPWACENLLQERGRLSWRATTSRAPVQVRR